MDAHDASGALLPDAEVLWASDVDGYLGTGNALVASVSGGGCGVTVEHITVTVNGANGKMKDTITIQVGQIC